ncbi:MAG TPA: hypothetical protein VF613_09420 [Longimicrobium sp.]|jgi:hypothetical protein
MHPRARHYVAALLPVLACACYSLEGPFNEADAAPQPAISHGGEIVLTQTDLTTGGSLMEALAGRVSNMRVSRSSASGCSRVIFRGVQSIHGSSEAHVWVDGQAATDSCILDLIRRWDVDRVEIYPSGLVRKSGYPASATGSILVFTKRADM